MSINHYIFPFSMADFLKQELQSLPVYHLLESNLKIDAIGNSAIKAIEDTKIIWAIGEFGGWDKNEAKALINQPKWDSDILGFALFILLSKYVDFASNFGVGEIIPARNGKSQLELHLSPENNNLLKGMPLGDRYYATKNGLLIANKHETLFDLISYAKPLSTSSMISWISRNELVSFASASAIYTLSKEKSIPDKWLRMQVSGLDALIVLSG